MKASATMFTAAAILSGVGSSTAHAGRPVVPLKPKRVLFATPMPATAVAPGVVVGPQVPYAGGGDVAISVVWTSSQAATLQNKASWKISTNKLIPSIGVFSTGTYTVTFGPCSLAGYTPPPPKSVPMPTANKKVTLTVTYGH